MPSSDSREKWDNRLSFLLACLGSAVGLGNIWRFPYLCYKSGGGAFLIPYLIMILLCGTPLLFMELAIGQYTRRGPVGAMARISPMFKGVGIAIVVMSFWFCGYYNIIISWSLFYLISSVQDPLPWTGCHHKWNSKNCWDVVSRSAQNGSTAILESNASSTANQTQAVPSTQEFYDRRVLQQTKGIEDMGSIRTELLALLVLAWILVYFCIWKSVKATGKVVYVTATLPYLMILVFLWRGLTLPGAMEGLEFLFKPKWEMMLDPKVWVFAAAQTFNSVGIGFGSMIAFSSYNRFHGPLLRDTIILIFMDALTCLLCGATVFSTMGNLALEQGTSVDRVVTDGPGLVFVVFPHALAKMPMPQIWSVVFFSTLIMLGIDSQFASVEVVVTCIKDSFGSQIDRFLCGRHEILVLLVCLFTFVCGFPNVYQGGVYYFQLVDYYSCALSLMCIAFFECVSVLHVYGAQRLKANIRDMTGSRPSTFFTVCWKFVSPGIVLVIWCFSIMSYSTPTYNKGTYQYPAWAVLLGWCIAGSSLVFIPLVAIYQVARAKATGIVQKVKMASKSTIDICPCGCERDLNENHEAHLKTTSGLIQETCDVTFEKT